MLIALGLLIGLYTVWMVGWTNVAGEATHRRLVAEIPWATSPSTDAPTLPATSVPTDAERHAEAGTTIAVLRVPRFGSDYIQPISEGVDKATVLDTLGIGHYPGSALPGQLGNFAIAAHRTTFGKPFSQIAELEVGDSLVVDTAEGRYTYTVTGHEIVSPNSVDVIAPEPGHADELPSNRWITLTSCHPKMSARQRYVVHGVLDSWTPKGNY